MRYISKKELAKHRALKVNKDFSVFQEMDLKNENEITLRDIASSEEESGMGTPMNRDPEDDDEGVEDLYQFWDEQDKRKLQFMKEKNPNIDAKL
jgi:hypothetical protein